MDLRRLEHFVALYELGTFGKAAEAVHLSQSALSRSIQALEDELGLPLFDRLSQGTVLTPAGQLVLPTVRQLLASAGELRRQVQLFRGGDLAEIRLGASPTPGAVLLRPLLAEAMRARPGLRIDARTDSNEDLVEGLRAEKFDLVVLDASYLENPEGFAVEQLQPQRGGLLVREGHPLLGRGEVSIDDLKPYPVMGVSYSATFGQRLVAALGPQAHPSVLITHFCDSYQIQRDLALRTDAVILCLHAIVQEEIDAGTIVPLPLRLLSPMPRGHYAMLRLAGRSGSPALDFVQQAIRGEFNRSAVSSP